ncbi:MAG TPA: MarR family transcriptional regulator [Candidatus Microbacterium stercoravium]|uniref:MarR family transcriptional regulator n=1 Tax=Candidatus Microbacterium stercoravium TaxID=2838697 RepID=A0A9D2H3B8_9MICO|nr:MarR family transcriptional regulator [Candidatus Microbacterium stercoravium]
MPESQQRAPASAEDLHYFSTDSDLIDRAELSPDDLAQCVRVMEALREWQESARALSEASNRYMRLNESDMRAIRMMIRAQRQQQIVTPKDIAREVGISSASTTKLIDRLVAAGHLTRAPHPTDRRTTCIEVTPHTRRSAHETIGRQHARRFRVAAEMTPADRETIIRFLDALVDADVPQGDLAPHSTSAEAQHKDAD